MCRSAAAGLDFIQEVPRRHRRIRVIPARSRSIIAPALLAPLRIPPRTRGAPEEIGDASAVTFSVARGRGGHVGRAATRSKLGRAAVKSRIMAARQNGAPRSLRLAQSCWRPWWQRVLAMSSAREDRSPGRPV